MYGPDGFWLLLGIAVLAYILITPVFGFVAWRHGRRTREDLAILRRKLDLTGQRVTELGRGLAELCGDAPQAAEAPVATPEALRPAAQPVAAVPPPVAKAVPEAAAPAAPPPAPPAPPAAEEGERDSVWRGLEESITSRWLVWLGGVTLALAGVFLVK